MSVTDSALPVVHIDLMAALGDAGVMFSWTVSNPP
jgi:hypothetical protein